MKHNLQLLALSSAATALASNDNSSCSTRPYSTWMADSIISRGQGIAPAESTSSIYLEIGVVQAALLQLLESPSTHRCAQHDYQSYVRQGTKSIVGQLLNASEDTQYPLDRLSLGRGLLDEYLDTSTSSSDKQTAKSALDTLKKSIDLQPKNQWGNPVLYLYCARFHLLTINRWIVVLHLPQLELSGRNVLVHRIRVSLH